MFTSFFFFIVKLLISDHFFCIYINTDTFKVLQYWTFTNADTRQENLHGQSSDIQCNIYVGARVHFIKSTMFKSKVTAGVEEELTELTNKWYMFSIDKIKWILAEERVDDNHISIHNGGKNTSISIDNSNLTEKFQSEQHTNIIREETTNIQHVSEGRKGDDMHHHHHHHRSIPLPSSSNIFKYLKWFSYISHSYWIIILCLFLMLCLLLLYLAYTSHMKYMTALEERISALEHHIKILTSKL